MANEIRSSYGLTIASGKGQASVVGTYTASLTGQQCAFRQSIPTSWTALDIPAAIASISRIAAANDDATNYVEFSYSADGSTKLAKLVALDGFNLPLQASVTAIYARANTAACWVSIIVCEP